MARGSTSGSSSHTAASASEGGGRPSDAGTANATSAATFDANQLFVQWLVQAQQTQVQMLQGWVEAVRAVGAQQPLLSSWAEMQLRWAQQMQEQTAQMVRLLSQQGGRESGAASGVTPFAPTALYEQAQATFDALARQWNGALRGVTPRA